MGVTINTVKIDDRQAVAWAQEATLVRIAAATENSQQTLVQLAQRFKVNVTGLQAVNTSGQAAGKALVAAATGGAAVSTSFKSFDKSLQDLRYGLGGFGKTLGSSTGALSALPGIVSSVGGGAQSVVSNMASLGRAAGPLGLVVGALTSALGVVAERMVTYVDTYRSMMQAGISFNGSLLEMAATVRGAGVSFETATQIAQNQTTMLLVAGERNFFKTVGNMEGAFSRFAMTMDQGAQFTAEYMESQRLSGALYTSSQGELEAANERMLNLMKAQERITGVNVRRQQEEQRAVMQRASMRLLLARRSPEEQRRAAEVTGRLRTQLGLSEEQASSLITEMLTNVPTKAGADLRVLFGSAIDDVITGGRDQLAGQTAGMDTAIERMRSQYQDTITRFGDTLAIGMEAGNSRIAGFATTLASVAERMDPSTIGPAAEGLRTSFDQIRDGLPIMTEATGKVYEFINRANRVAGELEAAAASSRLAEMALNGLTTALDQLIRVSQGRGPGFTTTAITPEELRPVTGASIIPQAQFEGEEPTPATLGEIPIAPAPARSASALVNRRNQRAQPPATTIPTPPPAAPQLITPPPGAQAATLTEQQMTALTQRTDQMRAEQLQLQRLQERTPEQNLQMTRLLTEINNNLATMASQGVDVARYTRETARNIPER